MKLEVIENNDNQKFECTGLIFKSSKSTYFDGKQFGEKKYLRLLKRKSCRCPECDFILSELKEYDFTCTTSFLNEIEDGELFTITPSYDTFDYPEYGGDTYLEDFQFVKIKR